MENEQPKGGGGNGTSAVREHGSELPTRGTFVQTKKNDHNRFVRLTSDATECSEIAGKQDYGIVLNKKYST